MLDVCKVRLISRRFEIIVFFENGETTDLQANKVGLMRRCVIFSRISKVNAYMYILREVGLVRSNRDINVP